MVKLARLFHGQLTVDLAREEEDRHSVHNEQHLQKIDGGKHVV